MRIFLMTLLLAAVASVAATAQNSSSIEVTGSSTISIVPDRITVEVGLEEYFKSGSHDSDSVKVRMPQIENQVRKSMAKAGIPDSAITTVDVGNWIDRTSSREFLLAKTLSVVLTDYSQLEKLMESLPSQGIRSFNITGLENSAMEEYNHRGLKAALEAARQKAQSVAEQIGMELGIPWRVVVESPGLIGATAVSNVALSAGTGMDNLRRIVRHYNVRVIYLTTYP